MPIPQSRDMMRRTRGLIGPAALPLFCLAPHGVFRASRITPRAVSSYLAFSPLPALFSKNRRYVFCDTFRHRSLSTALPAYFTRHAAVWCSDFPPATPKPFGVTSDHLPSARNLAQEEKSGSQETRKETTMKQSISWIPDFPIIWFETQKGDGTDTRKIVIIASAMISFVCRR